MALEHFWLTRRSQGIEDHKIAAEIGDKTGAAIIVSTYGGLPPNWMDTTVGKIEWLPADADPAWTILQSPRIDRNENGVGFQKGIEKVFRKIQKR
jgi:hypothetical protein